MAILGVWDHDIRVNIDMTLALPPVKRSQANGPTRRKNNDQKTPVW